MPQQPALYSKLSVAENLRLFARLEKVADVEAAVDRMLEQTGLRRPRRRRGRAGCRAATSQRVNIAIGLLRSPAVLLLDEPSASLDPRQRERLWGFIGGLAARGHGGRLLDPRRRRGRALRRPRARAGRRRAAVHRHAGRARAATVRRRARDFEAAFVALPPRAGPLTALARCAGCCSRTCRSCAARRCWSALLVVYPIVIALLIGLALDRPAAKAEGRVRQPRPAGRERVLDRRPASSTSPTTRRELFEVDRAGARRQTREEAIEKVRAGEVLGAIVIPADATERLRSTLGLGGGEPPTIEVYYNARTRSSSSFVETHDHVAARPRPTTRSRTPCSRRRPATST